jgi:ABC-type arginine/histidine transport system permease subunit
MTFWEWLDENWFFAVVILVLLMSAFKEVAIEIIKAWKG